MRTLRKWSRKLFLERSDDSVGQPVVNAARSGNRKFEQRAPQPQNAIDIFAGHWASDLSDIVAGLSSGKAKHFSLDQRPAVAMKALAGKLDGRGLRILELGPLEGGHTYQFEKMGVGEIVAIEANVEAFLKCLIVKNLAGLRTTFLHGDFVEYLKEDSSRYDFIFCCGVLYHMQDPLLLIELMAARTDRIFVWTHYHTEESRPGLPESVVERAGQSFVYHQLIYENQDSGIFWGGNKPVASFLSREDILRAFKHYGFTNLEIHNEVLTDPGGPCFSISFWRT